MTRRDFIGSVTITSAALVSSAIGALPPKNEIVSSGKILLQPFDYSGVKLLPSRWQKQYAAARDFYLGLPDDDILPGFRVPKNDEALTGYFKPLQSPRRLFFARDDLSARGSFRPFHTFGEGERYHTYFESKQSRQLWQFQSGDTN